MFWQHWRANVLRVPKPRWCQSLLGEKRTTFHQCQERNCATLEEFLGNQESFLLPNFCIKALKVIHWYWCRINIWVSDSGCHYFVLFGLHTILFQWTNAFWQMWLSFLTPCKWTWRKSGIHLESDTKCDFFVQFVPYNALKRLNLDYSAKISWRMFLHIACHWQR